MESLLTSGALQDLAAIVFIDLILAGDNALVIALAARNLPAQYQKKAIFWGTLGAIVIRAISTLLVVWLLQLPGLMILGGLLLLLIAYQLVTDTKTHEVSAAPDFIGAIRTIIIADGVMGIDNVLGIAGIAKDSISTVIVGILITIPIIVWGSTFFIQLIERFPLLLYGGSAILAWTAGGLFFSDPLTVKFAPQALLTQETLTSLIITAIILALAWRKNAKTIARNKKEQK
ncbi:MAG: TerC family protein [Sporomusaceae bacterium]|nr:TerC family protein [Sporomusaceae bacterium]